MIPTPFDGHPPAAEPGARLGPFDGGVHRITQVEQRALPHHHVAVQTGNLEQLVHDRVQLRGLGAEDLQRGAPTDRWLPEVAAREKAQVAAQDAERPTQLVRSDAQELALRLARCPRLLRSLPTLDVGDEPAPRTGDAEL